MRLQDLGAEERKRLGQSLENQYRQQEIDERRMEPPSAWDRFKYGFSSQLSDMQALFAINEQYGAPAAEADRHSRLYPGRDMPQETVETAQQAAVAPQEYAEEVRQRQQQEKDEYLRKNFEDIHNTPYASGWPVLAGSIAKALATPTTLIPLGHGVKAGAAIGAGVAGTEAALVEFAERGEVSPANVGIALAAGGVLGGAIAGGGKVMGDWIDSKKLSDIPVTTREASEMLDASGITHLDARQLANEINAKFNLGKGTSTLEQAKRNGFPVNDDPDLTNFRIAQLKDVELENAPNPLTALRRQKDRDNFQIQREFELEHTRDVNLNRTFDELTLQPTSADDIVTPSPAVTRFNIEPSAKKDFIEAWKQANPTAPVDDANRVWNNRVAIQNKTDNFSKDNIRTEAIDSAFLKSSPGREVELSNVLKYQAGAINQQMMLTMGGATVGGLGGYAWNGEEGAIIGALLGGGLPWTLGKTYRAVGTIGERSEQWVINNMSALASRPSVVLESYGKTGSNLAKGIERAFEEVDLRTGDTLFRMEPVLKTLSNAERDNISRVLQKTAAPVSDRVGSIAAQIQSEFVGILKKLQKAKIISDDEYRALRRKSHDEGYWPRIWNEPFLTTKKGKEQWTETMSSVGWTEDSLRKTLSTLLGKDKYIDKYIKAARKDGSTLYLSKEQARSLLRDRKVTGVIDRASHLRERKIDVGNEELLRPFLVTDPEQVLTDYFHQMYKRIEFSKIFGANDEVANRMFAELDVNVSPKARQTAQEIYYTSVGDARSSIVTANMNLSETWKRIYGFSDALQTLKLTMAQILNSGQALVNGSVYMSKGQNPVVAFTNAIRGIARGFGSEGRDFAARAGAANETTMMEIMGELAGTHTIAGRKLPMPLEILNNPALFLKYTRYTWVEKTNRKVAANMGKIYVEGLLAKLQRVQNRPGVMQFGLEKTKRALDELGINHALYQTVDEIPEREMLRAALKFSNTVNFRVTPDKMPLMWQSPHAKLFKKFKTFMFHQGAFIKDNLIKEAYRGNFGPLITYMVVGGGFGMTANELRRMLRGDDAELSNTERYLQGISAVGAAGLFWDTIHKATSGRPGSATDAIAGPQIGDIQRWLRGGWNAVIDGNPDHITRAIVNGVVIPFRKDFLESITSDHKKKKQGRRTARVSRRDSRRESRR